MQKDLPDTVDTVIVGGGIAGTSTCYFHAAETDRSVLLLEKDNIASGATGDSSAIIRHHYGASKIYAEMAKWSHKFYREFEERTGQPLAYNSNPLLRLGVEGDESGAYAMNGHKVLEELNIPVSRLEREDFTEEFPMISSPETDFVVNDETAAYSSGTDACIGFVNAAREAGAMVDTGTKVTDIKTKRGKVVGVQTPEKTIETENVVVTAGPWTTEIMETIEVDVPIELSREQILLLESESFSEKYSEGLPTSGAPGEEWYARDDFVDGILIATHTHESEGKVDPDTYKDSVDEDIKLELIDNLVSFCPDLEDAGLQGEYCGIYSNTPDFDFILDEVGPDGCVVGCGFSGHGFKQGPAIGKILSDLVTKGDSNITDVDYFSLDRFEKNEQGHGVVDPRQETESDTAS